MATVIKKQIFCANEQADTDHDCTLDQNKEVVASCVTCGRILKFPMPKDQEHWDELTAAHQQANAGQVSVEKAAEAEAQADEAFKKAMGIA